MNTWVVGNSPIGHYHIQPPTRVPVNQCEEEELGAKVFLMKARIMAGQVAFDQSQPGISDFKWLAKEEVKELVAPFYWKAVKNLLPDL